MASSSSPDGVPGPANVAAGGPAGSPSVHPNKHIQRVIPLGPNELRRDCEIEIGPNHYLETGQDEDV